MNKLSLKKASYFLFVETKPWTRGSIDLTTWDLPYLYNYLPQKPQVLRQTLSIVLRFGDSWEQ